MEKLNISISGWLVNKINQLKTDQLKMTIEEAVLTIPNLYEAREKTIIFLTREAIKRELSIITV
jgi:hypothetical protein